MGGGMALWYGFSSFFSIWQICILQISPFFVAFMVGQYLLALDQRSSPGVGAWIILPGVSYTVGFSLFYSLLIASGLDISRLLIFNLGSLKLAAGIVILLAALYILLNRRLAFLANRHTPLFVVALSLLIGICFALIYSPCITPALSEIMSLASQKGTAVEGWNLALLYGLGISIALLLTTLVIVLMARKQPFALSHLQALGMVCGFILLIPALLNITGLMRHYKALILGFLV